MLDEMGVPSVQTPSSPNKPYEPSNVDIVFGEMGILDDAEWRRAAGINLVQLREMLDSLRIEYHKGFDRFQVMFNHPRIKFISFSPQLGYVLGFERPQNVQNGEIAKYGCDLKGGFTSFAVYSNGLTEDVVIGNTLSPVLRVVSIGGLKPGEFCEICYTAPMFHKVQPREVQEIQIELRALENGRLVPFGYGQVMIVLLFKKVINF